jgi:hypothetical protein
MRCAGLLVRYGGGCAGHNVHHYYEVEPLGVYLAEIITGSNVRFYYKSGEEFVKVR